MTYRIIREKFEFPKNTSENDLINKAFEDGLQNGYFETIGIFPNWDAARLALVPYKTERYKQSVFASWVWVLDLYYIEELDENGDPTGDYNY